MVEELQQSITPVRRDVAGLTWMPDALPKRVLKAEVQRAECLSQRTARPHFLCDLLQAPLTEDVLLQPRAQRSMCRSGPHPPAKSEQLDDRSLCREEAHLTRKERKTHQIPGEQARVEPDAPEEGETSGRAIFAPDGEPAGVRAQGSQSVEPGR